MGEFFIVPLFLNEKEKHKWDCVFDDPKKFQDFIQTATQAEWNYLSMNPKLTCQIVDENISCPWSWYYLSKHLQLNMNFFINYLERLNPHQLCQNPSLTPNMIRFMSNYYLMIFLIKRCSLTVDLASTIVKYGVIVASDTFSLSALQPIEFLLENPELIDFDGLSHNKNLTEDIVRKHKGWNLNALLLHPNIGLSFIAEYRFCGWDLDLLYQKPKLTVEFLRFMATCGMKWNLYHLANYDPRLVMLYGAKYKKEVNWGELVSHPNLPGEYIKKYFIYR